MLLILSAKNLVRPGPGLSCMRNKNRIEKANAKGTETAFGARVCLRSCLEAVASLLERSRPGVALAER